MLRAHAALVVTASRSRSASLCTCREFLFTSHSSISLITKTGKIGINSLQFREVVGILLLSRSTHRVWEQGHSSAEDLDDPQEIHPRSNFCPIQRERGALPSPSLPSVRARCSAVCSMTFDCFSLVFCSGGLVSSCRSDALQREAPTRKRAAVSARTIGRAALSEVVDARSRHTLRCRLPEVSRKSAASKRAEELRSETR